MGFSKQDPRLVFFCEQWDNISHLMRRYLLLFFYEDRSIEMRELPKNVLHLKRTVIPHLKKEDFNVGVTVTIFGLTVELTAYADQVTRELCQKSGEFTVVLLGESLMAQMGRCLTMLTEECGFTISDLQMAWAEPDAPERFNIPEVFVGGRVVVVKCARVDAILKGLDYVKRTPGAYASSTEEEAKKWVQLLAHASTKPVAVFGDNRCSVVLIKPHAVQKQVGGSIIQHLLDSKLDLTALALANLSSYQVDKFIQPYKGVLTDIPATAQSLVGTVWLVQLVSLDEDVDVVAVVREVCGPFDPCIAKELRPKTIRAKFGVNHAENAVHCCDLSGEGSIYTNFFFTPRDVKK